MDKIQMGLSSLKIDQDILEYLPFVEKLYLEYINDYKRLGLALGKKFLRAYQEEETKSTNELEEISPLITVFYSMGAESIQIEKILRKVRKDGQISHKEINEIHKFVMRRAPREDIGEYRSTPVVIGKIERGMPVIAYKPPKVCELEPMMNTFLDFYNKKGDVVFPNIADVLDNNPFIKGIISHAYLVSIHPYRDGNGRMSRMIQSMKMWGKTEEIYNMKLFLPPIHLSSSYGENRFEYTKHLNLLQSSEFDPKMWNLWIKYNLLLLEKQIKSCDEVVKEILPKKTLKRFL